jgi:carbamoyltransferase
LLILGISAFYHDSAACLLRNGEVVAAIQEERFSRIKHDASFPAKAVQACLDIADVSISDVDCISYYEKSSLKFDRLLKTYLMYAPKGLGSFLKAMPIWLTEKLQLEKIIRKKLGFKGPIISPEHHQSHAASSFYPSPFEQAAFLTMDGVGEWKTLSFGAARGNNFSFHGALNFPHSLGLLYSAFTYYCGFKVNSGEYKLMGLAPYGKPKFVKVILDHLLDLKEDGSFRLDMSYFDFAVGDVMTNDRFHNLFGRSVRKPESRITDLDMDLASSIQAVTEEIILRIARYIHKQTGEKNLCLSGGVALNCVANGRLYREGPFEKLWVQPASGDAGSAVGAALWLWYSHLGNTRAPTPLLDRQKGSLLGTEYTPEEVRTFLDDGNITYIEYDTTELSEHVAALIADNKVIGWFSGRMEFGPRALGNRSILGDPRSETMQSLMNLKIKYRESFRPFAPMILAEDLRDWFEVDGDRVPDKDFNSAYMLMVGHIRENRRKKIKRNQEVKGLNAVNGVRSEIPAVTHVDFSARMQTVHEQLNPQLHALVSAFKKRTGCPILINTSFNVRGEPMVESPKDAYRCFMRTEMDYLVLGSFVLKKEGQPVFSEERDWRNIFELD